MPKFRKTKMHSSRLHTARLHIVPRGGGGRCCLEGGGGCCDLVPGGGRCCDLVPGGEGGVVREGGREVLSRGGREVLWPGPWSPTSPSWTDRCLWKHNLRYAGGNKDSDLFQQVGSDGLPLCYHGIFVIRLHTPMLLIFFGFILVHFLFVHELYCKTLMPERFTSASFYQVPFHMILLDVLLSLACSQLLKLSQRKHLSRYFVCSRCFHILSKYSWPRHKNKPR